MAAACALLELVVKALVVCATLTVVFTPLGSVLTDPVAVALVLETGQALVQGIALVNGSEYTGVADAKTGAWEAICGFGWAPGPCGFSTLSITCKTPLAIRMSAVRS